MPRGTVQRRAAGTFVVLVLLAGACGCGNGAEKQAADSAGAVQPGARPEAGAPTTSAGPSGGGSTTTQVEGLDPALAVPAPGPLTSRLQSADLLVSSPGTLAPATLAKLKALPGVTKMLHVSMAQVQVEGRALNVLAVDPATYRPYVPRESADLQAVWDRVASGEVAVPATADKNLIDPEGFLTLGTATDSPRVHVGAFAPQVPSIDAVVNTRIGAELGMTPGSALIISTGINAPAAVQKPVQRIVGDDVSVQALDVVAQLGLDINARQTAFLVGSVAQAVGTYGYTVAAGGTVVPQASWVKSHISSRVVPILGRVTCNNQLFPQLDAALREVVERGLSDTIHPSEYAGCYYPRFIAGSNRLSNHAFGLALDLNVPGNGRGTVGEMNRDVVAIFKKWGFAWGGDWGYTDPMHFEMAALVNPR